jgi:hypothetical protein
MRHSEQPRYFGSRNAENSQEITYSERSYRGRRVLHRAIAVVALLDFIYISGYKIPIMLEEIRLSETEPMLKHVSTTPNHLAAETIVIGGFGIKSSEPNALALPELNTTGGVEALVQDNQGIGPEIIADMIIRQATADGLLEIGLWGDSNGGLIAAKVARVIQQSDSQLRVRFIVLDCTPTSINALREDKRNTVDLLESASSIFPDITSHPLVGYLYAQDRLDKKYNGESSVAVGQVFNEMYSKDSPSSTLLAAEALLVVHTSLAQDLKDISDVKDKAPPLIISIRPTSNTGDKTVDSSVADTELNTMLAGTNLTHVRITLPDIVHGDPTANAKQYQDALTSIVLPALEIYDKSINSRLYRIDSVF